MDTSSIYLGGFSDIASGFYVTAANTPASQVQIMLTQFTSAISFVVTFVSMAFLYLLPGMWVVKGLISTVPVVGKLLNGNGNMGGMGGMSMGGMGGGGSKGPIIGYIADTWKEFLVSIVFALNGASGMIFTEMGLFSTGMAAVVQRLSNASFSTADNPASIKQFKDLVKVTSDADLSSMYEHYVSKEQTQQQSLTNYVKTNSPDSTDMNYKRQQAAYTASVCRAQIISEKLQNDNYGSKAGISDSQYFKRHLVTDSATSNTSAPFNSAFIVSSMVQAFGTNLPTGSN